MVRNTTDILVFGEIYAGYVWRFYWLLLSYMGRNEASRYMREGLIERLPLF